MGIECRLDDTRTRELLAALNHHETALRVTAERAMNTVSKADVRYQLVATPSLLMAKSGCVRWSARRTVRRLFAVNAAVRRKMPNKWGFRWQKSY
ncbi:hypothetical protein ECZU03_21940 [Escherichia coli]|nr:hypothetical protein ECZU03_21940 [Escherichia coli]